MVDFTRHKFTPRLDHPRICSWCGREVNDYQYHLAPVENCDHRRQSVNSQGATCDICGLHAPSKGWVDTETLAIYGGPVPTVRERGRSRLIDWLYESSPNTIADRIEALERLLRVLVFADEGSQDAFGHIASDIAKRAKELLK